MYLGKRWDEIIEGQSVSISRTITEADQVLYGGAAGDFGPVHFDRVYAADTVFKKPIASGIMLSGYFTSILTSHLVGVYPVSIEDRFSFTGPVFFGDTIKFTVTVKKKDASDRTILWSGVARNIENVVVLEAEAKMKFPKRYM